MYAEQYPKHPGAIPSWPMISEKGGFAAPWRRALDRSGPFGENSSAKREWLRMNRPRPRNLRTDHELPEPNLRKFWRESCDVTLYGTNVSVKA